jgi:hypothetical protein
MTAVAETVRRVNMTIPIKSLQVDQEPQNTSNYDALVKMLVGANAVFPTSTVLKPLWM